MLVEEKPEPSELRNRVFQIERLRAMPIVISRLVDALADDRSTPSALERIIEGDQALASKILSLANSAYYGFSEKITTIRRAIVVIGFKELQLLALGASLAGLFDMRKAPPGFDSEGLWHHCMAVSWAARELALASRYPSSGEVMLAGLLHDLGKLVLATHLADYYVRVLKKVEEGVPYHEAEEQVGVSHTMIGNWLARKWNLPDIHVAAIRDHHSPRPADLYFTSTSLVHLADKVIKTLGFGLVHQAKVVDTTPIMKSAGLTMDKVRSVAFRAREEVPPLLHMWRRISMQLGD
jgi:putative nucleotidyltransferase with HDIG domain